MMFGIFSSTYHAPPMRCRDRLARLGDFGVLVVLLRTVSTPFAKRAEEMRQEGVDRFAI
jgi:hypothetical protein